MNGTVDEQALSEIGDALMEFARGEPMHFEVLVAEGVYFSFDCPHEEDLMEMLIPVSVRVASWSPHKLEGVFRDLMDYGSFGDTLAAELSAVTAEAVEDSDPILEHAEAKPDADVFHGALSNPRVEWSFDEWTVKQEYA